MSKPVETDLYAPVKAWLEGQGYLVKGEVGAADVVAQRHDESGAALAIVELKLGFSLVLLQQAVARQAVTDTVYVAVPRWKGKAGWKAFKGNIGLCRRLGLGVLSVRLDGADGDRVQEHAIPGPFQPRKSKKRHAAMIREFEARKGDPTQGGTNGQVMTSYRQDAMRCAAYLADGQVAKGSVVAGATGVSRATQIMADNHYGWFCRAARGLYALSDVGLETVMAELDGAGD
ncbi:DUF2161 family putative PD-(D/E)XK-type phosphodiesterase [Roseovarius aestuarii]|nr:DUF2161 family putative PD-(D/E)XK-type phosphodiesterase [Roseovarius aestuarii]